jgi:thiosulfate/3-mercaptopyruvate sulfurtransferase
MHNPIRLLHHIAQSAVLIFAFFLPLNLNASDALKTIVDTEWLAHNMHNPNLLVVDVREGHFFSEQHLVGSVNLPYPLLFDDNLNLPTLSDLQQRFSAIGIDASKTVVVIDDGGFKWAARLVWILHTLGHDDAKLLNVGFGAWPVGLLATTDQAHTPTASQFITRVNTQKMKSYLDTLVATRQVNSLILDARPENHYLGLSTRAQRAGHIPNAQSYPAVNNSINTGVGGQLRDLDELALLYKELPEDKPIILYCNDGASAAINYVVLKALGYQAAVYEGSWLEWGNNPALPIKNPSQ